MSRFPAPTADTRRTKAHFWHFLPANFVANDQLTTFHIPTCGNQRKLWLQHPLSPLPPIFSPQRTATFPHPSHSSRLEKIRKTIHTLAAKIANCWMVGAFPVEKKINVRLITTPGHHRKGKWRFVAECIYVMCSDLYHLYPSLNLISYSQL